MPQLETERVIRCNPSPDPSSENGDGTVWDVCLDNSDGECLGFYRDRPGEGWPGETIPAGFASVSGSRLDSEVGGDCRVDTPEGDPEVGWEFVRNEIAVRLLARRIYRGKWARTVDGPYAEIRLDGPRGPLLGWFRALGFEPSSEELPRVPAPQERPLRKAWIEVRREIARQWATPAQPQGNMALN